MIVPLGTSLQLPVATRIRRCPFARCRRPPIETSPAGAQLAEGNFAAKQSLFSRMSRT
jgi:hypothetical protein